MFRRTDQSRSLWRCRISFRVSHLVWIADWELDLGDHFVAKAKNADCAIDFQLVPEKQPVLQGENGFSRKASQW